MIDLSTRLKIFSSSNVQKYDCKLGNDMEGVACDDTRQECVQ